MGTGKNTAQETLEMVQQGVEDKFDPFHAPVIDVDIMLKTNRAVKLIVKDEYETTDASQKWEKVDYVLRLSDFIETLGVATDVSRFIWYP